MLNYTKHILILRYILELVGIAISLRSTNVDRTKMNPADKNASRIKHNIYSTLFLYKIQVLETDLTIVFQY